MNGRSELVDVLGRLSLFADFSRPELEAVAHAVDEEMFAEGQRVLRQGLSGSGFFVILEGNAAIHVNGESRWTLGPGDFFGETSLLTGGTPTADVVATRPLALRGRAGPGVRAVPAGAPAVPLPPAPGRGGPAAQRARVAPVGDRPFPPGDYDVVVVGSGPGGLQTSYELRALGIRHAVCRRTTRPAACSGASPSSSG